MPASCSRVECNRAVRQQHRLPALAASKTWLDEHAATVLPKRLLGTAIASARNQWPYPSRRADDGNIPVDNNPIECDIMLYAAGKKTGFSAAGAQASAVSYSLMLTCHACEVERYTCLRHMLTELPRRAAGADVSDPPAFSYEDGTAS